VPLSKSIAKGGNLQKQEGMRCDGGAKTVQTTGRAMEREQTQASEKKKKEGGGRLLLGEDNASAAPSV
jgi:hypothetical protein